MSAANEGSCQSAGSVLFRCGWCGHPTDKDGNPIHTDDPGAYVDSKMQAGAKEELLNGACCPNGNEDMNPPTHDMLMDAGLI